MKSRLKEISTLAICAGLMGLSTAQAVVAESEPVAAAAEEFINSYIRASENFEGPLSAVEWIKNSKLVTDNFKQRLEALYKQALEADPELGYGADAVIGGQDWPDRFYAKNVFIVANRAEVLLSGPEDFPMTLKMILVREGERWLVEASGDLVQENSSETSDSQKEE